MRTQTLLTIAILLLCTFPYNLSAQCVDGAAGGNPNLTDNGDGTYEIACDGGNVDITSTTYNAGVVPPSAIQWTSGQTGNFVFTPDCNNLGCTSFTPCIPAGTAIPQQCVPFSTLGVPLNGTVPAGGSVNLNFNISGICYVPGTTYSGALGINLGGSGDVSLSVVQPDGVVQGPLTFSTAIINSLSPIPLSLLGLNVDPNGAWAITIADAGAGSFSYTIDPNSEICVDATTTPGVLCSHPIEVCVVGGCPSFVSASASATDICSGDSFTLDATIAPADATNVTYTWTGTGINAANQNSASPTVSVTNTTCAAVTESYSVTVTCTNNGSVLGSQTVAVTVYPEIDPNGVIIDNTTNINDPNCSIAVSYPACAGFSISGNTVFSPGDNGTIATYTISNGNPACDITVSSPVNCIGDCTPADATAVVSACDANGNFTVDVTLNNLGNSNSLDVILSDGTSQLGVTSAGTLTFGPYASGTSINIKLIDANDPNCNINLGEYTQNCFDCPNLTTLNIIPSDVCGGDAITLAANVDQGVEGTDYSIQWFENGVAIVGGNTAAYTHTALAADPCNLSTYTYSAELTCLNNGVAASTTTLSLNPVNVYPVPQINVDFVFENCSATPIDNCGNLVINTGGATDPAPGGFSIVNYTISVPGAPAACEATGTVTVDCPSCTDYPGNATATETVVCWGESFDISNTNALVSSLGYEVGYVVTPNPPSAYPSTSALLAASLNGTNGAFAAPGSITPETYTNNGSLFTPTDPCGELVYFTPFISFACQSYTATNESATIETPPGTDFIAGIYQNPGVSGTTLSVPQVPYCPGLVSYDIQLCVNDETDDGAGLLGLCFAGEDPLQMSSLFGIIGGLPGGGFSNFPNINNIHDSQSNVCYSQNGWTTDPSGELVNLVTVNLQDFCAGGNDSDFMSYDFRVDVNCNRSFPTLCPDCDVIGAPVAVRFLPPLNTPTTGAEFLCEGDVLNLLDFQFNIDPAANYTITWIDGNGAVIPNPATVVPPVGFTPYCYEVAYCDNGACIETACLDVFVEPRPTLAAPVLGPVCPGEAFDLTSVESSIATGGTFTWSVGNALSSGGAAIFSPTSVIPIASEQYCAQFTDATGCTNTVCGTFTYETLPVLLTAAPEICEGNDLELTDYNTDLTTNSGTYVWYDTDPALGGNALAATLFSPYDPATDGTTFWAEFTDAATGCKATTSINVTPETLPVLLTTAPEICEGDDLQLTDYNTDLTTNSGTFTWYNTDPALGGNVLATTLFSPYDPAADGTTFWAEFTDATTGCTGTTSINVTTDPCCATVDLDIRFDGFPFHTSWDITDASGVVVASSGGTYSGQAGNSQISLTPACLPDGCYDLTFYDVLNNGMCPFRATASSLGTFITPGTVIQPGTIVATLGTVVAPGLCGNYQLYDANGDLLVSGGGGFGASETNNFCLVNGVMQRLVLDLGSFALDYAPETDALYLDVYPSPATEFITIHHDTDEDTQIRIVDINGRILQQHSRGKNADPIFTLGISDIPIGVNFVQLITPDGVIMTKKFMKQ